MKFKILVLSGTAEAKQLCAELAENINFEVVASIAGIALESETDYPVQLRMGGFGGIKGMVKYIRSNQINLIADATHPFATQISYHAVQACEATRTPYVVLGRPGWTKHKSDDWTESESLEKLFGLFPKNAVVFAPMGSGMFKADKLSLFRTRTDLRFVVRVIQDPKISLPQNIIETIEGAPPFSVLSEKNTLQRIKADCLLCRNSGGVSGENKIKAARQLQIPIYMLARQSSPLMGDKALVFHSVELAKSEIFRLLETVEHT